jgi:tellurite resistance protein TerC
LTILQSALPFVAFTASMLALVVADYALWGRHPGPMTFARAAASSVMWIGIAAAFGLWVLLTRGADDAIAFAAAYVTEESLSLDNMVVFVAIFSSFAVPVEYQRRVLSWGVVGAMVMRAAAIFAGVALLERLSWITYIFGALLVIAAARVLRRPPPTNNAGSRTYRFVARLIPVTTSHGGAFFVRADGKLSVTPLFLALVSIELSDVVFATDSIPAVFAVTRDPFLVFTSNVLAVLGLRSLYFLVAGVIPRLRYIRYGLGAILAFVGAKMMFAGVVEISTVMSLTVILVVLAVSVAASVLPRRVAVTDGL